MAKEQEARQTEAPPLHPNEIIREHQGPKFFGLKPTQLVEAIKTKKIPPPFALTDGGRAKGWTGQQIIDYQQRRLTTRPKPIESKKPP